MDPFFEKNFLIHTHLEKTAGSTLVEGLRFIFGRPMVHDVRSIPRVVPAEMSEERRNGIAVLTGHFIHGAHDRHFSRRPVYIACIREPYERFRSFYYYVLSGKAHSSLPRMQDKSLGEVIADFVETKQGAASNYACRYIGGKRTADAARAIRNAEDAYVVIAPHKRVNELIARLNKRFGEAEWEPQHRNPRRLEAESEEGRDLFRAHNADDYALYDHVLQSFDRWMDDFDNRLEQIANRSV